MDFYCQPDNFKITFELVLLEGALENGWLGPFLTFVPCPPFRDRRFRFVVTSQGGLLIESSCFYHVCLHGLSSVVESLSLDGIAVVLTLNLSQAPTRLVIFKLSARVRGVTNSKCFIFAHFSCNGSINPVVDFFCCNIRSKNYPFGSLQPSLPLKK